MSEDLDDILNDSAAPEAAEVETPEPETAEPEVVETQEADASRPRDEKGRFARTGEKAEEASPAPQNEPPLEHPALLGERRRRQEAEERARQLEAQIAQFSQQQAPQAPPQPQGPPDRWEDPEGYDRWLVEQASFAAEQRAVQRVEYRRIEQAAAQFKADKPDYPDVIQVFGQMAQFNPGLVAQMQQAENPAKFAYETAKTQLEIQQYGGIDGLIQARVEAALKAQAPAPVQTPSIPETLADAPSAAPGNGPVSGAPPSLESILGIR